MDVKVIGPDQNSQDQQTVKVPPRDCPSDKLGLADSFRNTGICRSICNQDCRKLLDCIRFGEDVNVICDKTGNSLLHVILFEACPMNETKYVPMVYQLSNADMNLDVRNKEGVSPLHLSIKMHLLELMIALIKCGSTCDLETDEELIVSCSGPVEYEFRSAYRKFAPGYWLPVEENKSFKVNVLVKSWCRININRNNKSLIEFAKEKNADDKIVRMLMNNEVSIEFAHATIAGDYNKMENLLKHFNVDMETKDLSHKENFFEPYCPLSLYGAAIKYGHRHVLHLLKNSKEVIIKSNQQFEAYSSDPSDPLGIAPSSSSVCTIL